MKANYYFAAMSLINPSRISEDGTMKKDEVISDFGEKYIGFQTNEIPTYFFMEQLAKKDQLMDHISFFVTKECLEKRFMIEGHGQTTCEYLQKCFAGYLNVLFEKYPNLKNVFNEKGYTDVPAYLDKILHFSLIEDTSSNRELYDKLSDSLNRDLSDIRIFMDVTGGARLSQIISLLLMRTMENMGAEVAQIVYVDITKGARLIDATNNYRVCRLIEEKDNSVVFANEAKKVGIVDEDVSIEELKKVEEIKVDTGNTIKATRNKEKKQIEKLEQKKTGNSIVDRKKEQQIKDIKKQISIKNPFTKLKSLTTEKIIVNFYEESIYAFCEAGVIQYEKQKDKKREQREQREIKNLIEQILFYYNKDNRGNDVRPGSIYFHSVIGECKRYLDYLQRDLSISPVDFWNSRKNISDMKYSDYRNLYSVFPGKQINQKLIAEYEQNNGKINACDSSFLDKWAQYQIIYANYGFPFMLISDNKYYDEIRQYYLEKVSGLMERLNLVKERSLNEYSDGIEIVRNNLSYEIPICADCRKMRIDEAHLKGMDKVAFMQEFAERMEIIRPYRNDIAHKAQRYTMKEKEDIAARLREWSDQYEQLIG